MLLPTQKAGSCCLNSASGKKNTHTHLSGLDKLDDDVDRRRTMALRQITHEIIGQLPRYTCIVCILFCTCSCLYLTRTERDTHGDFYGRWFWHRQQSPPKLELLRVLSNSLLKWLCLSVGALSQCESKQMERNGTKGCAPG